MTTTQFFTLSDGRRYAYLDLGPSDGPVVVFLHGIPGCRLELDEDSKAAIDAGLRVIKPDRPGWGQSDPLPDSPSRITDYAVDLQELLDHLGVEKFALWGISAGGPHVMGAIHHMADRVVMGFIMSGLSDLQAEEAKQGMKFLNRLAAALCLNAPGLFRVGLKIVGPLMFKPKNFVKLMSTQMAEVDHDQVHYLAYFTEALRQGVNAYIDEAGILFGQSFPWGVDPDRLRKVPLYWWQGAEDKNVPAIHGKIFQTIFPHTQLRIFPGEGHLSYIDKHSREIVALFKQHLLP